MLHQKVNYSVGIIRLHGITQDPDTKNYMTDDFRLCKRWKFTKLFGYKL